MSKNNSKVQNTQPYEQDLARMKKSQQQLASNQSLTAEQEQNNDQSDNQKQFEDARETNEQLTKSHHLEDEQEEIPSEKDKLIEYLKETLRKAEITMGTVFVAIQIEKEKRGKLIEEIAEKKTELEEVHTQENNFLSEKVNEKMATALQRALEDKDIAEAEYAESQQKMEELENTIKELDENIQNVHIEKSQKEVELQEAQYRINEQESMMDSFNIELKKMNNENKERAEKISHLTTEVNDMKGIIESLTDVRAKLNHYLKDETPTQSRQGLRPVRTPQEARFDGVRGSGDHHMTSEPNPVFDLPTKSNNQPSEDDFWYAESKNKYRASNELRRVEGQEPWQPKVQYYEMPMDRNKTPEHTVRLPNINASRPEYLYKNKEYIDEFGNSNQKNLKKGQVQQKRRAY